MPSTTDRPDGSEDPFAVAEALQSVVRETEPLSPGDRPDRTTSRDTEPFDFERFDRETRERRVRAREARDGGSRAPEPRDAGPPAPEQPDATTPAGSRTAAERTGTDRTAAERTAADRTAAERAGADRTAAERNGTRRADTEPVTDVRETVLVDDAVLGRRETVRLPSQRRPPESRRSSRAPLPIAVAFATTWAALFTYLPVAAVIGLARTLEGSGGIGGAAHAGLAGWMLGHGVPVGTSIGPLAITPLLLTVLVVWRLSAAGLHVTRAMGARHSGSAPRALLVAVAVGVTYSLMGTAGAHLVDGRGTEVSAVEAALHFLVLGVAGAGLGSLRGTGAVSTLARRLHPILRHGIRSGLVAAFLILAAGAVAGGLSLALGGGSAAEMIAAYRTGVAGQAGITLLSIAYAVNASVWSTAYLLGPGFALGTDSAIRLTEVTVGPLPTLPLLAGLPPGPMGAWGALLLTLPVIAGGAAGWLLTQRLRHGRQGPGRQQRPKRRGAEVPEPSWSLLVGASLLSGPVAGVTLGLLSWASGGALGDGRLSRIGPDPVQVGLVAAVIAGVAVLLGTASARLFAPARRS
ncbi:DUF6350 family protein [Actinoplanes sp. NBRC 101535]|uniref:cell division protein PerM n=1 Tax=Actinoplanes sp. NBRC 101535 TaxID=3032196 RepID=UPI00249FB2DA|nr:DUF6350 family protein [Actinoplanes sp. NBRC 101535]GLY01038.1 hypothetical protein Acsp01_14170 [Actinoplanes sp. NBRC 101535]